MAETPAAWLAQRYCSPHAWGGSTLRQYSPWSFVPTTSLRSRVVSTGNPLGCAQGPLEPGISFQTPCLVCPKKRRNCLFRLRVAAGLAGPVFGPAARPLSQLDEMGGTFRKAGLCSGHEAAPYATFVAESSKLATGATRRACPIVFCHLSVYFMHEPEL